MGERVTFEIGKVALADDDADDRELFQEALTLIQPNINLLVFKDGNELLTYLNDAPAPPEIIFVDLNMPKKNGYECLTSLRRDEKFRDVAIVIFTTSLHHSDVEETFKAGANYFLKKPNDFETLKSALRSVLFKGKGRLNTRKDHFILNERIAVEPL